MTASVRYVRGQRYALLRGVPGWWLRANNVPALRTLVYRGHWVHHARVPDLIALMESVGARVIYSERDAE